MQLTTIGKLWKLTAAKIKRYTLIFLFFFFSFTKSRQNFSKLIRFVFKWNKKLSRLLKYTFVSFKLHIHSYVMFKISLPMWHKSLSWAFYQEKSNFRSSFVNINTKGRGGAFTIKVLFRSTILPLLYQTNIKNVGRCGYNHWIYFWAGFKVLCVFGFNFNCWILIQ